MNKNDLRPRRAIRWQRVLDLVPLGETQIRAAIRKGKFPKPFKVTEGGRAVAFFEDEVLAHLAERAAEREDEEAA